MQTLLIRGILTLAVVAGFSAPSWATTILLDQCNAVGLCSQVGVSTTLSGSSIDVDVFDVPGGPEFGIFGDTGGNRAFAFNVVDPDLGVAISHLTPGFSFAGAGADLGGPFGAFEFVLNGPQGGAAATLPLHFTVDRTNGFTTDGQLFEFNSSGYVFAAHVRNNDTGLTGWAASDDPPTDSTVPEPASLTLLGSGVAALLARRARRRRP